MCGIYAVITKSGSASQLVFNGLKDIEYRGYDSWGIALPGNNAFEILKDVGFLPEKLPQNSKFKILNSNLSLGHTRWATHGGVTKENAHPHSDCQGEVVLVHNGIVENYLALKNSLKRHKYKSETDSEVIVHAIEEELKKIEDFTKSVANVFNKLDGLSAIVVSDGKKITAAKKGSPLVAGKLKDGFALASDPNALLPHTNQLIFLEDGEMVELTDKSFKLFEAKGLKEKPVKFQKVEWDYASASLQNYPHFMLKEITEQPQVILNVLKSQNQIKKISEMIKSSYGTYFVGCGTAAYSCLEAIYLFSAVAKRHVNFSIGSEFNYSKEFLKKKSLLIAISQSGETIDVIEPVQTAKKQGADIVAITNVLGSSLYRLAGEHFLLNAGVEKGVASTKAMIAMLSAVTLLAFATAKKADEGKKVLEASSKEIKKIVEKKLVIKKLADKIYKSKDIYVLGRGLNYPVALEAALKIKEISYIHAEGFAAGELKHGVIALIEKGTPVIVFVPNDETKEGMLANAMEVKARGAFVIGVGVENNPVFDYFFEVKDTGISSVIPHIVFAQLLAYYLSTKLGYNPDKPRNLAKSVVVR